MHKPSVCLLAAIIGMSSVTYGQRPSTLHFSAEDDHVPAPVPTPRAVLRALIHSGEFTAREPIEPDWFSTQKVREPDLFLVEAVGQLRGANVTTFWLLRSNANTKRAQILWSGIGHDLQLDFHANQLYPHIIVSSSTATSSSEVTFARLHGKYQMVAAKATTQ